MIFLIEYDRPKGDIVRFESFSDGERVRAENLRLKIELDLSRRGVEHEVVLLEAASKAALRQTHRRYFEDPRQIMKSTSGDKRF